MFSKVLDDAESLDVFVKYAEENRPSCLLLLESKP